jgi:hypothetical protein
MIKSGFSWRAANSASRPLDARTTSNPFLAQVSFEQGAQLFFIVNDQDLL